MPATIKDIARTLNISVSTVSYALNGGPRPVPDEVKRRVLETAKTLNYRPNRIARSMVTGRRNVLGVVPMEVGDEVYLSPYLQAAFGGAAQAAARARQDFHVFTRAAGRTGRELADVLVDGQVDGVVFLAPALSVGDLREVHAAGLPFVVVGGQSGGLGPTVEADNGSGMAAVVRHLAELGHRRVGYLAGRADHLDAEEREAAFFAAAREIGWTAADLFRYTGDFTIESGERAFAEWRRAVRRPTALVCANDESAIGVLRAATAAGVPVPEALSVTGFDDTVPARLITPALTTVRQPVDEMAAAAFDLLLNLVAGLPAPDRTYPTDLVVRSSTSRPTEDLS